MASSIFDSVRSKRNAHAGLRSIETSIEDQLETLRDELASLSKLVGKNGVAQTRRVREQAEAGLDDLMEKSEYLLRELQNGYLRGTKEMRTTVRRHPLATVGAAAAVGVVFALLARR